MAFLRPSKLKKTGPDLSEQTRRDETVPEGVRQTWQRRQPGIEPLIDIGSDTITQFGASSRPKACLMRAGMESPTVLSAGGVWVIGRSAKQHGRTAGSVAAIRRRHDEPAFSNHLSSIPVLRTRLPGYARLA